MSERTSVILRFTPGQLLRWARREAEEAIQQTTAIDASVIEIAEDVEIRRAFRALLSRHEDGLSGSTVARELRRSKARVLAALDADPGVERSGTGRGSRYRLTCEEAPPAREPQGTEQEPMRAPAGPDLGASEGQSARAAPTEIEP